MNRTVQRFHSVAALSRKAAELICMQAAECVRDRSLFTLVLSGGSSPRLLYELLAQSPYNTMLPWSNIHLFWSDERFVPADHAESNYSMAYRTFISRLSIPAQNIHRIPTETINVNEAADIYEKDLKEFFHSSTGAEAKRFPSFDLMLLGMGNDGHTASLFSGDAALQEKARWVTAVSTPRGTPPVPRITLTLPVLNSSRRVLFLIAGENKGKVIRTIFDNLEDAQKLYPTAMVQPAGDLIWLIDESAV